METPGAPVETSDLGLPPVPGANRKSGPQLCRRHYTLDILTRYHVALDHHNTQPTGTWLITLAR